MDSSTNDIICEVMKNMKNAGLNPISSEVIVSRSATCVILFFEFGHNVIGKAFIFISEK